MSTKIGARTRKALLGEFRQDRIHIDMTVGDAVRIARELNGLSQSQLAKRARIPQAAISAIERNRINLGVERAKALARALRIHPAVLLFSDWNTAKESAA